MAKSSTSFKPNQSGNKMGRPPKGMARAEIFDRILEEKLNPKDKKSLSRIEEILIDYIESAKGDKGKSEFLITHYFGKPRETVDANVNGEIIVNIKKYGGKIDGND